jgi:iron complex outermembrane recepter protein
MKKFLYIYLIFYWLSSPVFAQKGVTLEGLVLDNRNLPLSGATVVVSSGSRGIATASDGTFRIESLPAGPATIKVSFIGFQTHTQKISPGKDKYLKITLHPRMQNLQEVVVADHYALHRNKEESLNVEVVNSRFVRQYMGGSLMNTLERLPGIGVIDIGSGQSKPVIRGLGFNQVVVVENGIRHEAQQWGADHGLEVDQYAFDRIEIIKGPASLSYGSDAIGGVIDLKQVEIPDKNNIGGSINLTGKSNNNLGGISANIFGRKEKLFFTFRSTLLSYADFRVPADSIDIYSFRIPLHNNRLRNSAGREQNLHFSAGFQNNGTFTRFYISNVYNKAGFFANTHGLEPRRVNNALHDQSSRDILLPYQEVNHFKILNRTGLHKGIMRLNTELGYQNNFRQEWSTYTAHGFMPPVFPSGLPFPAELERQFTKQVFSGNIRPVLEFSDKTELSAGVSAEYQENDINGRGFIIPAYKQLNAGIFIRIKKNLSDKSILQGGIRYDYGNLQTDSYTDWYTSVVEHDAESEGVFLERAPELKKTFRSMTWSAGYNFNGEHFLFKLNAGKSFRMPIAKELAANGVNYHRFSFEKGNPDLSPEQAYQLDAGTEWHTMRFAIGITPFVSYFPNYIFLNPGFEHDRLYGQGQQIFSYTQSRVFRYGGELHTHFDILRQLKAGIILNHIYSEQLSGEKKGFTLPFSTPSSALLHLKYAPVSAGFLQNPYITLDLNIADAQKRIVPPEEKTPGYKVFNSGAGTELMMGKNILSVSLQMHNILNEKYFSHTSYYRLINIPQPGRNFITNIIVNF